MGTANADSLESIDESLRYIAEYAGQLSDGARVEFLEELQRRVGGCTRNVVQFAADLKRSER